MGVGAAGGGTVFNGIVANSIGSLRLSWPLSAAGYRLEVTPDFSGNWEDGSWWGLFPGPEGEENVVFVAPSEAAQFFRLVKP